MSTVKASELEVALSRELAPLLARALEGAGHPDIPGDGTPENAVSAIAAALAHHRQRLGELVQGATETLGANAGFTTYTLVKMKSEGWTPLQVRVVIDDHLKLRKDMIEVRELVRRVFAGEP